MYLEKTVLREIHGSSKCRVPNDMIEVCVVNSKDYVLSNEKRNLEEQCQISDEHRITW